MTAEEINETSEQARTVVGWLREIAYQLALMNQPELKAPGTGSLDYMPPLSGALKRGPGRPRKDQ